MINPRRAFESIPWFLPADVFMNLTFETIGLEVPSEKAFNYLAERAGDQGEATQLTRRGAVLHGRCWKLGEGLEVWTVLYESGSGDVFYADCRPGFRAPRTTPCAFPGRTGQRRSTSASARLAAPCRRC